MFGQLLDICEIACGLIGLCSLAVAAWFELRDRWQTEEERAKTRKAYGKKWKAIRVSGLLQLPEKAIISALDGKTRLAKAPIRWYRLADRWPRVGRLAIVVVPVVVGAAGAWIRYGWIGAIAFASAFGVVYYVVQFMVLLRHLVPQWLMNSASIGLVATYLFTAGIWLNIVLGLGIAHAAGVMFILLPVYICVLGVSLGLLAGVGDVTTSWELFNEDFWSVFGVATAVSFFVTLCSLLIGNLTDPDAWIPQTLQMLLCNVVFDGFTMVATFAILARAVGDNRKYPIPAAILIDVAVAALFACTSLWLGLIGTDHALSINQVLGVLIAGSAENATAYAFGPYFWAMHTTFLPTLGYLALILLFWIAKLVVLPVAKVLKKGREKEIKPHSLTAGVFAFVGAMALLAAAVLHMANDDTAKGPSTPPAQVTKGRP